MLFNIILKQTLEFNVYIFFAFFTVTIGIYILNPNKIKYNMIHDNILARAQVSTEHTVPCKDVTTTFINLHNFLISTWYC